MNRNEYLVRAERSGQWWAIEVPEINGAFSQAKRIDQIEAVARELVSLMLDVPEDSFDLKLDVMVPPEWLALAMDAQRAKRVAEAAAQIASRHLRENARALVAAGLPYRDAASIMGVSQQRIAQLVTD